MANHSDQKVMSSEENFRNWNCIYSFNENVTKTYLNSEEDNLSQEVKFIKQESKEDIQSLFPETEKSFTGDTVQNIQFKLPKIILTNAQSLSKKRKNLQKMIKTNRELQNGIICITETWMKRGSEVKIDGQKSILCPRDVEITGKERGGGLAVFTENMNVNMIFERQSKDYQLMALSYKDKEHPENAPPLILLLVYVQPEADQAVTGENIEKEYTFALKWSNGGPVFLLGDFNWLAKRERNIADLEQYVTCLTTERDTLDKCYGNVKGAYTSLCKPPLVYDKGHSDHNIIILIPNHKVSQCQHTETTRFWKDVKEERERKKEKEKEKKQEKKEVDVGKVKKGVTSLSISDKQSTPQSRGKK